MMKKELKERYKELVGAHWNGDQKMVNYLMKDYCVLFEIDGGIAHIDKPSIKTRFCFGYHLNRYVSKDFDDARDMANYAAKSVEYFKKENLKDLEYWIGLLKECKEGHTTRVACVGNHYSTKSEGLKRLVFLSSWELEEPTCQNKEVRRLTEEEIDTALEAYEKAKVLFEKRLNTYLKRYGLSKVDTWTYWADE